MKVDFFHANPQWNMDPDFGREYYEALELMERFAAQAPFAPAQCETKTDQSVFVESGRKGGLARARNLSPEDRSRIASQAARTRWRSMRLTM